MALRLDPFRRIVGIGFPPPPPAGVSVRTFLERVFVSELAPDLSIPPYETSQHFFHYRRTPTSALRIIQRMGYKFDAAGPTTAEEIIGAEYFRVADGHTAAAMAGRSFVEIAGASFFIPSGDDPRAWPLPEEDSFFPGTGTGRIDAANFYQWRDLTGAPPPPVDAAPIAWSAFTLAGGNSMGTIQAEQTLPSQAATLRLTVGASNVPPGRDRTGFTNRFLTLPL